MRALRTMQQRRELVRVEPRGKWHVVSQDGYKTVCQLRLAWGAIQAVSKEDRRALRVCVVCAKSAQRPGIRQQSFYELFEVTR